MLTEKQVAAMVGMKPSTIRRYIRLKLIPAEPIMGSPRNGYLIPGEALVARFRERNLPGQARMVEMAIEALPEME
jgi:hypothetical protein